MSTVKFLAVPLGVVAVVSLLAWFAGSQFLFAHCDTMTGPVIPEAKAALEKGDVTPVLKWIKKADEAEVRAAFKKALAVRDKGPEAKDLADTYFLETLIRLHRAGEGAPYTGLKADEKTEPGAEAADKAIADGSVDKLAKEISDAMAAGVKERFSRVIEAKKHVDDSVEAGRKYVAAYVEFIHYVEAIHKTIASSGHHKEGEPKHAEEKRHEEKDIHKH